MNKEKTITINCEICDTRKMLENTYEAYDKIILNAEWVIVNKRSKALFEKLNIICNAEEFISVDNDDISDIPIVSINGNYSIGSIIPAEDNIILIVEGGLTISTGAGEALKRYHKIAVDGNVMCPESMAAYLPNISVNGSTVIYPDDYTLLSGNFIIDKYFPLRAAQNGKYFVPNTVKLLDKEVNTALLAEKKTRFKAKKLLVPEEKLEELIPLFDETTEFIVVPRGFTIVDGSAKLDYEFVKEYGNKIFVYGNLDARGDIADIVPQISSLIITGKVTMTKKSGAHFRKINSQYKKSEIVKEVILRNKAMVRLKNKNISEDGISVVSCGVVAIAKDVTPENIMRFIDIKNVGIVTCSEEQVFAVETVGVNIGRITTEQFKDTVQLLGELAGVNAINTEKYVM